MSRQASKKLGLWILVIALFGIHLLCRSQVQASEASIWKEVYARTGDCRISFPSLPQMFQQTLKLNEEGHHLVYDIYLAPYLDRGVCVLLVAQYPSPVPAGQEVAGLEGLLKGIVGHHPDNKLVFGEMVKTHGFPTLNFLVQSGKNYFRGQALMVGNKLYMIAMEGRQQQFEESTFKKFLESFHLLPS
jgi:hypothetical protein